MIKRTILFCTAVVLLLAAVACGETSNNTALLTTDDFVSIELSAPEGSGSIRTMTLHYMKNGEEKTDVLDDLSSIENKKYDDEAKEQTLTDSDSDGDGIVDFIIYREFWFPDLNLIHPEVPRWPTVYEYDLNSGFVIASGTHKAFFETYAKSLKDQLDKEKESMSPVAIVASKRMIFAAEHVADGSFVPANPYADKHYYEDIYRLTKDIKE